MEAAITAAPAALPVMSVVAKEAALMMTTLRVAVVIWAKQFWHWKQHGQVSTTNKQQANNQQDKHMMTPIIESCDKEKEDKEKKEDGNEDEDKKTRREE